MQRKTGRKLSTIPKDTDAASQTADRRRRHPAPVDKECDGRSPGFQVIVFNPPSRCYQWRVGQDSLITVAGAAPASCRAWFIQMR